MQSKQLDLNITLLTTSGNLNLKSENFLIMYANVDSLPNKMEELKKRVTSMDIKPDVIALTEIKHKNKWNLEKSELQLDGCSFYCNVLEGNSRGIINYVKDNIRCKQLIDNEPAKECLLLSIQINKNDNLYLATIYRSPNSTFDNDMSIIRLVDNLQNGKPGQKLIIGDFSWPHIDWINWSTQNSTENKFIDTLRKNSLNQHIKRATRARGKDTPHLLDLVISNDYFVDNIDYDAPFGKSDHCVLLVDCNFTADKRDCIGKLALSRGDYDGLRNSLQINWHDLLIPYSDNIDDMWLVFKSELENKICSHIPTHKSFNSWKKDSWTRPLSPEIRKMISKKRRLWTRYIETRDAVIFKKYKSARNAVSRELRKLQTMEQQQVAVTCKENPKKIWKYVNSKRKNKSNIGDLKTQDTSGNDIIVTEDKDRAEVLGKFFSSVFTQEAQLGMDNLQDRVVNYLNEQPVFTSQSILDKLSNLNITKSPGPDLLHPRVLYEIRREISQPLQIIFTTSLHSGKLPMEWKSANVVAIHKKGNKYEPSNYRPVSLTCIICKLMESIIRDNIMSYFFNNDFFSNKQYGFIKGRSTVLQLLRIMDDWTCQLESGSQIDVIYTDFQKAFDKVNSTQLTKDCFENCRYMGLMTLLYSGSEIFCAIENNE